MVGFVDEELTESLASIARIDQANDIVSELIDVLDEAMAWSNDAAYVAIAAEVMAEALRNPEVGERVTAMQQQVFETLADSLRRGQERREIEADVDVEAAAALFLALADGAAATSGTVAELGPTRRRAFLERLVRSSLGARA